MSEEKSNVLTNHIESKKVIELIVIAVITAIVTDSLSFSSELLRFSYSPHCRG